MKTAETIETSEERKEQQRGVQAGAKRGKYKQGTHPNSHRPRPNPPQHLKAFEWRRGQSGNPSGKPKADVAHQIARAAFENNADQLYEAFSRALLKGNAYAFSQLADRAYGKIAEKIEFQPGAEYRDMNTEALIERVKQLELKLGVTISADNPRGTRVNPGRTLPPDITPQD